MAAESKTGTHSKENAPVRKRRMLLGGLAAAVLVASGIVYLGIARPFEPRVFTILYTCDSAGELKPCG